MGLKRISALPLYFWSAWGYPSFRRQSGAARTNAETEPTAMKTTMTFVPMTPAAKRAWPSYIGRLPLMNEEPVTFNGYPANVYIDAEGLTVLYGAAGEPPMGRWELWTSKAGALSIARTWPAELTYARMEEDGLTHTRL